MLSLIALLSGTLTLGAPSPLLAPLGKERFRALHQAVPDHAQQANDVASGDVDGDGDVDAFVLRRYGNSLYLNGGGGHFTDGSNRLPASDDGGQAGLLADVDGDGDVDAVAVQSYQPTYQNRLYSNSGSGIFVDATSQLPSHLDASTAVAAGDVDGDGDLDLWIGNGGYYGGQDRLYVNDGTGLYSDATGQIPVAVTLTHSVDFGDVDADGDVDALIGVLCDYSAPGQSLLVNDGLGNFMEGASGLPVGVPSGYCARLVDLDGDADLDAVVATEDCVAFYRDLELGVFLNDGSGSFSQWGPTIDIDPNSLSSELQPIGVLPEFEWGDVDDDGDPDIWVGAPTHYYHNIFEGVDYECPGGQSLLLINDGTGILSEEPGALPLQMDDSRGGVLADLDGDADLDLWVAGQASSVQFGDGSGRFASGDPAYPQDSGWSTGIACGDVNGDGRSDLFLARGFWYDSVLQQSIWLGDGTGGFTELSGALPVNTGEVVDGAFGDVDGDGDEDLLVATSWFGGAENRLNSLYLNDGTGHFSDASDQLAPFTYGTIDRGHGRQVELVDVDGDGDLDAFAGDIQDDDGGGGGIQMWLNDGTGTFTNGSMQFAGGGENNEMVVGDVDGDGDPDTIYDNEPFGLVLELNDGAGVFTYVFSQIPTQANSFIEFIQMGDIDGDSDLDVVFGRDDYASTAEEVVLWKNDGAGTFTEVAAGLPQQLHDYRLGDIDDDGDLDLVSVDSILLNDGAGSFTPDPDPSPFSVSDPANDLALLDLDLDGDLDAVFTRYGVDRIYTNLTRQLSWRALPRLGQTLTLDIYGPQDGVRVLLASTARLSSPIGTAEGFVQVDPASLFLIKFGMLDGNGESSFVRTVPVDPTLAGVTVWWQAYVAGPARPAMLTNLESTLLSTF